MIAEMLTSVTCPLGLRMSRLPPAAEIATSSPSASLGTSGRAKASAALMTADALCQPRDRAGDLQIFSLKLSQLSYRGCWTLSGGGTIILRAASAPQWARWGLRPGPSARGADVMPPRRWRAHPSSAAAPAAARSSPSPQHKPQALMCTSVLLTSVALTSAKAAAANATYVSKGKEGQS